MSRIALRSAWQIVKGGATRGVIVRLMLGALVLCGGLILASPSVTDADIVFSDFNNWDYFYFETDPVNVIWYDAGHAWDVQYDMKNWTPISWVDTQGAGLYVYFGDSCNGGTDAWRFTDYHLMKGGGTFWGTRIHCRVNGAGCDDPHGFGGWSVGCPHKEKWCYWHATHHVSSYTLGREAVYDSFVGQWFVGSCYNIYIGNEGNYADGTYHDGYATIIDLNA
jgi:hypothetical protein